MKYKKYDFYWKYLELNGIDANVFMKLRRPSARPIENPNSCYFPLFYSVYFLMYDYQVNCVTLRDSKYLNTIKSLSNFIRSALIHI